MGSEKLIETVNCFKDSILDLNFKLSTYRSRSLAMRSPLILKRNYLVAICE